MTTAPRHQIHVLHVDDEPRFTELTGTFLQRENDKFTVETSLYTRVYGLIYLGVTRRWPRHVDRGGQRAETSSL